MMFRTNPITEVQMPFVKRTRRDLTEALTLPPPKSVEIWQVKKTILSREKETPSSIKSELVKYHRDSNGKSVPRGVGDDTKEWYVQITVQCGNVIKLIGEVDLPEFGEPPSEEFKRLVDNAHKQATWMSTNGVDALNERHSQYEY